LQPLPVAIDPLYVVDVPHATNCRLELVLISVSGSLLESSKAPQVGPTASGVHLLNVSLRFQKEGCERDVPNCPKIVDKICGFSSHSASHVCEYDFPSHGIQADGASRR